MIKNNGNFIKVHKIERSATTDEFILPANFIRKLNIKDIMSLPASDWSKIKDRPLYIVKDYDTQIKLEKLLGK